MTEKHTFLIALNDPAPGISYCDVRRQCLGGMFHQPGWLQ